MTIRPYPCSATVICGPCLPCPEFTDLSRASPDARVVYATDVNAVSFVSGSVTYTDGGAPISVGMAVVGATQKLCLGRNQSVNGPLVYVTGIPTTATITDVGYTYYNGTTNVSVGGTVVSSCTDYTSQILRVTGGLDCDAAPSVVLLAATCLPCAENTGTHAVTLGSLTTQSINRGSGCTLGSDSCVSTTANASGAHLSGLMRPASFTPGASARPCNWTGLAFTCTLISAYQYSGTNTPLGGIVSCTITYTKNAGDDVLYLTSDAVNTIRSGCKNGYDQLVRTDYITVEQTIASYNIPCSGYKLQQYHLSATSDACIGGGRQVPATGYIRVEVTPR